MPSVYVSGSWWGLEMKLYETLETLGYSYLVAPERSYGPLFPSLEKFYDAVATMENCDLLLARPEDVFEIGFMYGLHKPIVILGLHRDMRHEKYPTTWAGVLADDFDAVVEVLTELRPVVGDAKPPTAIYAEVIARLKSKSK